MPRLEKSPIINGFPVTRDCPRCQKLGGRVTDSRQSPLPNVHRSRRCKCEICGHRWTTHEMIVGEMNDGILQLQIKTKMFLRDVERAAREAFGDETGRMVGAENSIKKATSAQPNYLKGGNDAD